MRAQALCMLVVVAGCGRFGYGSAALEGADSGAIPDTGTAADAGEPMADGGSTDAGDVDGDAGPAPDAGTAGPCLDVVDVGVGTNHTCAVTEPGGVLCWGANGDGQLGTGDTMDRAVPTEALLPTAAAVVNVSAGRAHTCASTARVTYCWGGNNSGQLGQGDTMSRPSPTVILWDGDLGAVTTGLHQTTCAMSGTSAYCWGDGGQGRLGNGGTTNQLSPTRVTPFGMEPFAAVDVGVSHTCAMTAAELPLCWGSNVEGRLGTGTTPSMATTPQPFIDANYSAISAGGRHSCGIDTGGRLFCWGNGSNGRLGTGSTADVGTPTRIGADTDWMQISAGGHHTAGIRDGNVLMVWGRNDTGQLGLGDMGPRDTPAPHGPGWRRAVAGNMQTCAIDERSQLFCWGLNDRGQIGPGVGPTALTPVLVCLQPPATG